MFVNTNKIEEIYKQIPTLKRFSLFYWVINEKRVKKAVIHIKILSWAAKAKKSLRFLVSAPVSSEPCDGTFFFFFWLWNDCSQNCWIDWNSAVYYCKRLFHISRFVRPLLGTILCVWEFGLVTITAYTCIMYFTGWQKKKRKDDLWPETFFYLTWNPPPAPPNNKKSTSEGTLPMLFIIWIQWLSCRWIHYRPLWDSLYTIRIMSADVHSTKNGARLGFVYSSTPFRPSLSINLHFKTRWIFCVESPHTTTATTSATSSYWSTRPAGSACTFPI